MSTSRAKQIAQKRKSKTKSNGTKLARAKRKNMKKSSIKHYGGKKR